MSFHQYASYNATATVKTITLPATANEASVVEMQSSVGPIRYTMDGATDPTQTSGMVLLETSKCPKAVAIDDIVNLRFCRGSATDAVLHLHYGAPGEAIAPPVLGDALWQEDGEIEWQEGDLAEWQ